VPDGRNRDNAARNPLLDGFRHRATVHRRRYAKTRFPSKPAGAMVLLPVNRRHPQLQFGDSRRKMAMISANCTDNKTCRLIE